MSRIKLTGICVLASTLAFSGCVARTYNLTRDRTDQDLSASTGNRGYLIGQAPAPKERESTRTVRVFEIELGKNKNADINYSATTPQTITTEEPVIVQEQQEQDEIAVQDFEKYTVAKNDTLQKISKKFYGTTKKWTKIYSANKDVLRGPDKLYPGQVLNIPSADKSKADYEKTVETQENLK